MLHPIQEITKGNNVAITTASSHSPDRRAHKLPGGGKKKKLQNKVFEEPPKLTLFRAQPPPD